MQFLHNSCLYAHAWRQSKHIPALPYYKLSRYMLIPMAATTHPLHLLLNCCFYAHTQWQSQHTPFTFCSIVVYMLKCCFYAHTQWQSLHTPCTFCSIVVYMLMPGSSHNKCPTYTSYSLISCLGGVTTHPPHFLLVI
jgi:hypothetical protein